MNRSPKTIRLLVIVLLLAGYQRVSATSPTLISAGSRGNPNGVTLKFSEPMDAGSALFTANYQINQNVTVLGASFGASNSVVLLRTSVLMENTNYTVTVSQVQDAQGETISPNPTMALFTHGSEFSKFRILRRRFDNLPDSAEVNYLLNQPVFPHSPSVISFPTLFEIPINVGDHYGSQLIGYYIAPTNGSYRFWMCSDDQGLTYLSTDADPAHKQIIAAEPVWNPSRDYSTPLRRDPANPENRSNLVQLAAGQRVYLEAVAMEFDGNDNLSVAVQLPGDANAPTLPISETNFALTRIYSNTFFHNFGSVAILTEPQHAITLREQQSATFTLTLDGTPPYFVQWFSNNVPIPGATNQHYITAPATLVASGAGYHAKVSNEFSSTVSAQGFLFTVPEPLPNLAGWWPGEQNHFEVANYHPATSTNVAYTNGVSGLAFNFNGSNAVVDAGDTLDFAPTNFTMSFWIYARRTADQAVFSRWGHVSGNPNSWLFTYGGDNRVYLTVASAGLQGGAAAGTTPVPLYEWHHITGSYDGATIRIYRDGQLDAQTAFAGPMQRPIGTRTSIGAKIGDGVARFHFDGAMDEVEIFNRVLSSTEIGERYTNAVAGGFRTDLSVGISADPDPVVVGSNLTYTITVTNLGPNPAASVVASNFLPANVDFVSANASVGSCSFANGLVTCSLGTLSNGAQVTASVLVRATSSSVLYTHATVSAIGVDPVPGNNNALARPRAVLEPIITTQPVGVSVMTNQTITLTGVAFGAPPLRYQWRLNGVNIPGETNSTLTIPAAQAVNAGSYTLVAHNPFGAVNSLVAGTTVQITALSGADAFSNRVSLTGASGLIRGTTVGATRETGEPLHAGKSGGKSVWYGWSAPATGIATIHLLGSSFDTLLGVYTGTDVASLTEAGSDEDRGDFLTSKVSFNASAGTNYAIALDGFANWSGEYVMSWSLETTTDTLPIITSHPQGQIASEGGSVAFAATAAGNGLSYQWFRNSASLADATNSSLVLTNLQMSDVGDYTVRITNDVNRSVQSRAAALELGDPSSVFTRDKFEDLPEEGGGNLAGDGKHPIIHLSVSAGTVLNHTFSTVGGTTQLRETNHCGVLGGSSRWLSLIASNDGIVQLDTLGSDFDTVLAVYQGADLLNLTLLACDNDGAPDHIRSLVRFPVQSNQQYRVVVDGVGGTQGVVRVNGRLGTRPVVTSPVRIPVTGLGQPLFLFASASNITSDLLFFWRFNNAFVPGATNPFFAISNLTVANAGTYSVVLSNFTGLITNLAAVVSASGYEGQRVDGVWQFRLMGFGAQPLLFETTSNFVDWVPWRTNPQPGPFDFPDPEASNQVLRFYRISPR